MPLASILSIDPAALLLGGDFTRRKNECDELPPASSSSRGYFRIVRAIIIGRPIARQVLRCSRRAGSLQHSSSSSSSQRVGRRRGLATAVAASLLLSCLRFLAMCPDPNGSEVASGASAVAVGVAVGAESGWVRTTCAGTTLIGALDEEAPGVPGGTIQPAVNPTTTAAGPRSVNRNMLTS